MITAIKDINLKILEKLPDKDLVNFSLSCKKAKELTDNETLWIAKTLKALNSRINLATIHKFKNISRLTWKGYYQSIHFLIKYVCKALEEDENTEERKPRDHFAAEMWTDLVNFEGWRPNRRKEIKLIASYIYQNTYQTKNWRILIDEVLINREIALQKFVKGKNEWEITRLLNNLLEKETFLQNFDYEEIMMTLRPILPEAKAVDIFLKKRGNEKIRKEFFFLCVEDSIYYDAISVVLKYMSGNEILSNIIECIPKIDCALDMSLESAREALYKGADISILDKYIEEEESMLSEGEEEEGSLAEFRELRKYLTSQEFRCTD